MSGSEMQAEIVLLEVHFLLVRFGAPYYHRITAYQALASPLGSAISGKYDQREI
jgi:hypothetical protein